MLMVIQVGRTVWGDRDIAFDMVKMLMIVQVGRTVSGGPWDLAFDMVSRGWLVTECDTWDPGLPCSDVTGHLCMKRVLKPGLGR